MSSAFVDMLDRLIRSGCRVGVIRLDGIWRIRAGINQPTKT